MYEDYKPNEEPVTAEWILAILRHGYRQYEYNGWVEVPGISLSFTTTIATWREALGLPAWWKVAQAFNQDWRLQIPYEEWESVLEPAEQRTLHDLCILLARHARVPRIRQVVVLGKPCLRAGAFFTIRSLLQQAGADPREIRPSTALAPYLRHYVHVFDEPIVCLAPGALPLVKIRAPVYNAGIWLAGAMMLCMLLSLCLGSYVLAGLGLLLLVISDAMTRIGSKMRPSKLQLGELKTFRDLSDATAARVEELTHGAERGI